VLDGADLAGRVGLNHVADPGSPGFLAGQTVSHSITICYRAVDREHHRTSLHAGVPTTLLVENDT